MDGWMDGSFVRETIGYCRRMNVGCWVMADMRLTLIDIARDIHTCWNSTTGRKNCCI